MGLARAAARCAGVRAGRGGAVCLVESFLRDDFFLVAYCPRGEPFDASAAVRFKIAAFWGGSEGSSLLGGLLYPELLMSPSACSADIFCRRRWWRGSGRHGSYRVGFLGSSC